MMTMMMILERAPPRAKRVKRKERITNLSLLRQDQRAEESQRIRKQKRELKNRRLVIAKVKVVEEEDQKVKGKKVVQKMIIRVEGRAEGKVLRRLL